MQLRSTHHPLAALRKPDVRNGLFLLLCAFLLLLAACAQVGLPTPQTTNERIAAAQASVTQARATTTQLLEAKKITSADAANVLKQTDAAREGIDVARTISATDPGAATSKLQAAVAILSALQAYLASKSP